MAVSGEKLTKSFAGIRVLDGVDISLSRGEVHALLGANGSGKSTLVKVLTGVYQPDGGTITVRGSAFQSIPSPHAAAALGIAVVHQEAPLIDTMTVAECIALFRGYPTAGGRIQWARLHDEAASLLRRFDLVISPRTLAGKLSPAERALVALVIALDRVKSGVELLILDEVTASLPEEQASIFLKRVGTIAKDGTPVLMVTHRLSELRGLASQVTILRDGKVVHSAPIGALDDEGLVARMVGTKELRQADASSGTGGIVRRLWNADTEDAGRAKLTIGEPALVVEGLTGEFLRDVDFTVHAGEIVGIAGLAGGSIGELPEILNGLKRRSGGSIKVGNQVLDPKAGPGEIIAAGVAVLPADRLKNGGIFTLTVADNIALPQLDRFWHRPAREEALLSEVISGLDIRPPSARLLFGKLSGGNQQKVLVGKWLSKRPVALVLDDPTSGVDPGAREKIFEVIRDAAREGVAVILFSTEPEQLAAICERVLVLRDGTIVTELRGTGLTRESVSQWCYA